MDESGEIKEFNWGPSDKGIEELLMTLIQSMITSALATVKFFHKVKEGDVINFQTKLNALTSRHINKSN